MKRLALWIAILLFPVCFSCVAYAQAENSIPEFVSFSNGCFALTQETNYEVCTLRTYESFFSEYDENDLITILNAYEDWFNHSSELSLGGEHHADAGRFGSYEQNVRWYCFDEDDGLTAFSMNLIDAQAKRCHIMLAVKRYDDRYALDLYCSNEVELTEYFPDAVVIPDFAAYAEDMILSIEEGDSNVLYALPSEIFSDILYSYSQLLKADYGFDSLVGGEADGIHYVWFESHETVPSMPLDDWGLDGKACLVFAFAKSDDCALVAILPDERFVMEDTGERYFSDFMVPMPVSEFDLTACSIPSFIDFSGDTVKSYEDGLYVVDMENIDVLDAYVALLEENYGFSSLNDGVARDFLCMWYSDYEYSDQISDCLGIELDDGTQAEGYVFILLFATEEDIQFMILCADGIVEEDHGERYSVDEAEPTERLTIPMMSAFIEDAASDTALVDGTCVYRITPENMSAVFEYLYLLESYDVYQLDESEEEYGLPMYIVAESCERELNPAMIERSGFSIDYYVLLSIDVEDDHFLVSVSYADCLDAVDTGERWSGVALTADQLEECMKEWPFTELSVPNEQTEASRILVSEPVDSASLAFDYSPDSAFMQDMTTWCAGRLSYEPISSGNHNVRNYSGGQSDYQLVQDYVDMLLDSNPYLELVDFHEESYDTITFYSYAINYTGNVNMGAQVKQTYTDNMCDVMLYGDIEYSSLSLAIWTPANMELVDLGMRWDGSQTDVSVGGASALADLYKNSDGSFETSDGRFLVAPGEAMILRDGEVYVTEATFQRGSSRDRIWMRYFYRNETLHFSYPTRSLMTGDLFRLSDLQQEKIWLGGRGFLEKESDFTVYGWDGLFLGANHDGDWVTPVHTANSLVTDATVRVMYMDDEIAVFYFFVEYADSPYVVEALCAVPLSVALSDDEEADYIAYVGQLLEIPYAHTEFGASFELFQWEILSGSSLATLDQTNSRTCRLKGEKTGVVTLRMTYQYGATEPNVLTGNPSYVSHTKTQDYTVVIRE